MRVGWLADEADMLGGAELTQAEFKAAAPEGVETITLHPDTTEDLRCEAYAVHNCMNYTLDDLRPLEGKRIIKYWHDVGPWLKPDVYAWLQEHTTHMVCCSPLQSEMMGRGEGRIEGPGQRTADFIIPPAVDLDRFSRAAANVNGGRRGSVCVASWRNIGKGQRNIMKWAQENGGIDIYGGGMLRPDGSKEIPYDRMPELLAHYERLVFLPTVLEPFGRVVVEAWAAGCEVVTNWLVGARYWIEENPEGLETAAESFWQVVTDA